MGGAATLKAYAPVFAGMVFCPTGGLAAESAARYLALPNVAMVGGAWMAPREAVAARDWQRIVDLAREAAALGRQAA
jgi:2-dehydro-3-deoxyphosphogluconate aldolase/(4S)-4-hydroxy-2-oxoglutarate aldolase